MVVEKAQVAKVRLASASREFEQNTEVGRVVGRWRRESVERTARAVERTKEVGKVVSVAVRRERRVSAGLYVALLAVVGFAALREATYQYHYHRYQIYNEFADWTREMCADAPWRSETVLCQSAKGNWMARQLIRMKLQERNVDNCERNFDSRDDGRRRKPSAKEAKRASGCRHEPCPARGLSSVLFWLSRDPKSPINKLTFLIGPVKKKLRAIFEDLGRGDLPLSRLNAKLNTFPDWLRDWALPAFVWPQLRTWGVIIVDAPMPQPDECPCVDFADCPCRFPFDMDVCKLPTVTAKPPTVKQSRRERREARRREKAAAKAAAEGRVLDPAEPIDESVDPAGEVLGDTVAELGAWASDWIDWILSVELQPSSALERFSKKAEELYQQQCGGPNSGQCAFIEGDPVDVKDEL